MSTTIKLVQGDDLPGVTMTIRDSNLAVEGSDLDRKDTSTWRPVDLTGSYLSALVTRVGESVGIDRPFVAPVDASKGKIVLHISDCTFMENPGEYECEITVAFGGGQQTVYDRLTFEVRERIHAS